ncbi:MFS transporter, partial [Deltaproteobacteria bacterium OttesenSCG-928-K17]|nr:MFS transporter [Deltaproteobacteria bacterium OttesenSCG-928-K17]
MTTKFSDSAGAESKFELTARGQSSPCPAETLNPPLNCGGVLPLRGSAAGGSPQPLWLRLRQWLPVVCLAFVAFIFVTTELMPIGLLPDISRHFNRPEAEVGLMVTAYAWMVALSSLPLTMATGRLNRKTLLLIVIAGFIISQFLASAAHSFGFLLGSRLLTSL